METSSIFALAAFNRLHKKMNALYHDYARSAGLSDAVFWLLYSLYEHGHPCTQRDLCAAWFYAPQTINTALKNLEGQGVIMLSPAPGSRRDKQVFFTEAGKEFIEKKIVPLVNAEERSFDRLDGEERSQLLGITQKHIAVLEEEICKIEQVSSEDGSSQ